MDIIPHVHAHCRNATAHSPFESPPCCRYGRPMACPSPRPFPPQFPNWWTRSPLVPLPCEFVSLPPPQIHHGVPAAVAAVSEPLSAPLLSPPVLQRAPCADSSLAAQSRFPPARKDKQQQQQHRSHHMALCSGVHKAHSTQHTGDTTTTMTTTSTHT